jgi:hypothetical protein
VKAVRNSKVPQKEVGKATVSIIVGFSFAGLIKYQRELKGEGIHFNLLTEEGIYILFSLKLLIDN